MSTRCLRCLVTKISPLCFVILIPRFFACLVVCFPLFVSFLFLFFFVDRKRRSNNHKEESWRTHTKRQATITRNTLNNKKDKNKATSLHIHQRFVNGGSSKNRFQSMPPQVWFCFNDIFMTFLFYVEKYRYRLIVRPSLSFIVPCMGEQSRKSRL